MNINFFVEDIQYTLRGKRKLTEWIKNTLKSEKQRVKHLNIILTSDNYLSRLNTSYLNKSNLTDVISFDYSDKGDAIEGDIYISLERVRENANTYRTKIKEELHRVIIHGVLHLAGYSDNTKDEKQQMTMREDKYLSLRPEGL